MIVGGEPYILGPEGVTRFQILGIEPADGIDAEDPTAFITGLATTEPGIGYVKMTPLRADGGGEPVPIPVIIDVKPNNEADPTKINLQKAATVSAAILTTETFDATTVDPTSVRLGRTGTEAASVQFKFKDKNGDGKRISSSSSSASQRWASSVEIQPCT
jgi:hypothetical protein